MEGRAQKVGFCAELLEDDISTSADAGDPVGAGVPELSDHKWGTISQVRAFFTLGCDMV